MRDKTTNQNLKDMKFHLYGQKGLTELPSGTTVQDLRSLAHFNRVIKNYLKMRKIEKTK